MKVKFLQDYSGRETAMKQYHTDDVTELSTAQALELIKLGVAEEIVEVFAEQKPKGKVSK